MNKFARRGASAALSLMLAASFGLAISGCSADTLSGPDMTSYNQESTSGSDAGHNTGGKTQESTSGSDAGHNTGPKE